MKLVGLCGSLRAGSVNKMLLNEAVKRFGSAEYTEVDIRFPLYDGDLETAEFPQIVTLASQTIAAADAIVISGPEYNKGISGVLKNALDWLSRTSDKPFMDKPVVIMTAAAGRTGGETAQYMMRSCLVPFGAHVLTSPVITIAGAAKEFDEAGNLINDRYASNLDTLMAHLKKAASA